MFKVFVKSFLFSGLTILISLVFRVLFKTQTNLSDIGGINNFVSLFGTLYGIMTAFVVFEVWGEYNTTTQLIDKESLGLERLFRLTLYFRDVKFTQKIKKAIEKYIEKVTGDEFPKLAQLKRSENASKSFRDISAVIRDVKFNDNHDQVVFDQVINHYGELSQLRTERINQSLTRLPGLLRAFLYVSSFLLLLVFSLMPFANLFYGIVTTGVLSFVLAMVFQLIEDLDNPFVGYWNISPEAFQRAFKHIEEDY